MNSNFRLLLAGQSLANIGDVLYIVSIISVIYGLSGSATAASFVPFTITTSMFMSSLLTPVLIGKVNLKWLLTASQMGKTILLTGLGFMLSGITASNYYLIFVLIGLIACLDGCANPIRQTLIPYYVEPDSLLRANSFAETVTQVIQTAMWFTGSLLLVMMGQEQLIWLVTVLFAVASSLLCFLENMKETPDKKEGNAAQMKAGWKTLKATPVLRKMAWMEMLETFADTVWIAAILYAFVSDALNVGEKWWGFINGSFFLGLIIGSVYCITYSSTIEKKTGAYIFAGSLAVVIATLLFSVTNIPIIALILSILVGIFGQIKNIPQQTVIQTSVPKEKLSTVYTSLGAIGTGFFGIGSLIMGILADLVGVRLVFGLSGLLLALVCVIVFKNRELFVRNIGK
ncbi:ryptide export MFS transporter [Virgibacillus siamensis]|uniref:Ryptide export MFS transporter n=1 Tax=Virgibacillus siamensis TaxID=480071 RepID=A0ABP3QW01_9BACI